MSWGVRTQKVRPCGKRARSRSPPPSMHGAKGGCADCAFSHQGPGLPALRVGQNGSTAALRRCAFVEFGGAESAGDGGALVHASDASGVLLDDCAFDRSVPAYYIASDGGAARFFSSPQRLRVRTADAQDAEAASENATTAPVSAADESGLTFLSPGDNSYLMRVRQVRPLAGDDSFLMHARLLQPYCDTWLLVHALACSMHIPQMLPDPPAP
jgi:hypothetical protein